MVAAGERVSLTYTARVLLRIRKAMVSYLVLIATCILSVYS